MKHWCEAEQIASTIECLIGLSGKGSHRPALMLAQALLLGDGRRRDRGRAGQLFARLERYGMVFPVPDNDVVLVNGTKRAVRIECRWPFRFLTGGRLVGYNLTGEQRNVA